MNDLKDLFARLLSKVLNPRTLDRRVDKPSSRPEPKTLGGEPWYPRSFEKGDVTGQTYQVYDVLGMGGFGIVYLVYCPDQDSVYALKTLRDEYLHDAETRKRFRSECQVWIDLERHPHIVRAYLVDQVAGRLCIAMEYIAPNERGMNSLEHYLRRHPPDFRQSLRWAIQFCHGMEYAYSRGIRCHRDIKPQNILISQDRLIRISDFGLAGVIGLSNVISGIKLQLAGQQAGFSVQTRDGRGFGTPTHMAPEQFMNAAACDQRSDIYSFGVVLFQMRTGGRLPFLAPLPRDASEAEQVRFWKAMWKLHSEGTIPSLDSRLFDVIHRCVEKEPDKRYPTFRELRSDLESLLRRTTGEVIPPPKLERPGVWEWKAKGVSLAALGHYKEAVECFDKALALDPLDAIAWTNKGYALHKIDRGRYEEALRCLERALELDPTDAHAWNNRGNVLNNIFLHEEALRCYERALELDPEEPGFWVSKANALFELADILRKTSYEDAFACYDKALAIDPCISAGWSCKGRALARIDRHQEAISCLDKALELNPSDAAIWYEKASSLGLLDRFEEAIRCYQQAIAIAPENGEYWLWKGGIESRIGRKQEAVNSYQRAIELLSSKGDSLAAYARERLEELI
ncbi:MAG: serine/threonine-protein kinase [Acidobacteria bacterium]|nr:serine/threonine-protein kinase [Acidobacteriota bacterium]MCI0720057.1 serine/threonine-protein kinase [Acidobacteriota bacterium]